MTHVLHSMSGGRRNTASGKSYRTGTVADLWGKFSGYSNVRKYRVGPEEAQPSPVP